MNTALRLVLLAIACFAVTAVTVLLFNSLIATAAECYLRTGCSKTPIVGTIGFILDAVSQVAYFSIFPLGALLGRRDFRHTFADRTVRQIARFCFAAIPVLLFPFKYILFSGLW